MPLFALQHKNWFPPVEMAEEDGLLAIGGDLNTERLLLAYRSGIFPWYNDDIPLWWSPDPRFVLFPDELKVSKSMKALLRKDAFTFTTNQAFEQVIRYCRSIPREAQDGTWIRPELEKAYIRLHQLGYAHSAEVWQDEQLVGGLYGVRLGRIFFGESMFSNQSNASKYALIRYVGQLKEEGVALIDCQAHTPHLESMGAVMISRKAFMQQLKVLL
jgi:leucyl/phenylalanyl-tRNA---protein transferase